jgi:hypothetical protein
MRRARSLRLAQFTLAGALIGILLLVSACGGDPQLQQQASQGRSQFEQQLKNAQNIGVPDSALQPIIQQEQKLTSSSAPLSPFNSAPDNTYYQNQATSYQQLLSQIQQITAITVGQDQGQAQQDLLTFKQTLATQQTKKVGDLQAFSQRYTTDARLLTTAQTPNDYVAISTDAENETNALGLISPTYNQLTIFKNTISQMSKAHLDVTSLQSQYTSDLSTFNTATSQQGLQQLSTLLNAQYQLAVSNSIQSIPYVGAAKLKGFQSQINQLKTYGMDTSPYQKLYNADQQAISKAKTIAQYLVASKKIDTDVGTMQTALTQGAANYNITELNNLANAWGNKHLYTDTYDNQKYILDAGYTMAGIGYWLQSELSDAVTPADYQSVLNEENNDLFNLKMFEQDYSDKTPYNQVHQTDLEMMQHYPSLQHGTVVMVSMAEQAMRVYSNGKLIRAFQVTTGRVELPSLPGIWTPLERESPTEFTSSDPPSSPFWYPPTKINYAIEYHADGYFLHDSWWRNQYGPGTQFPHVDSSGNSSSFDGSHGCVNIPEDDAAWLYANTDWSLQIALY